MAEKRTQSPKNFRWEEDFDRHVLLRKIASFRTVSEDGRTSFNAYEHRFWRPVLMSSIRANTPEGQRHKRTCIRSALNDPKVDMTSPDKFLQRCETELQKLTEATQHQYHVLFHVTYQGLDLLKTVKVGAATVSWNPSKHNKILRKAKSDRAEIANTLLAHRIHPIDETTMTPVLVSVCGLDHVDAQRQALDALDRVRAIINMIVNAQRSLNIIDWNNTPHAFNRLRLGPYWTAHKEDGSLVGQQFWYEPRWEHRIDSPKFTGEPADIRRGLMKWIKKTSGSPLEEVIVSGILRYCRALDLHDTDSTLLGLWGALEYLTGTQKSNYDLTVSRIIRLFGNADEIKLVAQHLRLRRNASVHAARSPDSEEVDAVVLHAEMLVGRILEFLIRDGRTFSSHAEMLAFLDMDLDIEAIKAKASLGQKFIRYRTKQ